MQDTFKHISFEERDKLFLLKIKEVHLEKSSRNSVETIEYSLENGNTIGIETEEYIPCKVHAKAKKREKRTAN